MTKFIAGPLAISRRRRRVGLAAVALLGAAQLSPASAWAQSLNQLSGALGGLGSLAGVPSVDKASPGNIAGVMQYCVKNNYLSGGNAKSVASSALAKVTGSGQGTSDSGFQAGTSGLLQTGDGNTFSLAGVKSEVTKQACDLVLKHAQSLL